MDPSSLELEAQFPLSQFEPDPDHFGDSIDRGTREAALDWLIWLDVAHELAWAEIETLQITPRVPVLTWSNGP
jgi:hypothetical protein